MPFAGEHLLPGQLGHFFVITAFVASLLATIAYFTAARTVDIVKKASWVRFGRIAFLVQVAMVIGIFIAIFYICSHHYFEYLYAYKHSSKELEYKYLLACIWEDQAGSFLLWSIWHCIIGVLLIFRSKEWEAPVMSVVSLAQWFLTLMLLGIYIGDVHIGNSPFALTRNEINGPIFSQPNYLNFIKDGVGLNVLLRNYWMVIHPPILFLGFATTLVPFAYAYAGLQSQRYGDWVKPAIPWALFCACVLGVGIMMGGKWAYESLSFGGYWAWDPVENASLVPWLLLIAGLHTMVVYRATGYSLRASYMLIMLTFIFVLYSTFLTRTGILGDTSVHAFTSSGMDKQIYLFFNVFVWLPVLTAALQNTNQLLRWPIIGVFVICLAAAYFLPVFTIVSFLAAQVFLWVVLKPVPTIAKEEEASSREFWMFIGALVFLISALFILAKTSVPVYNVIFGTKIAQADDVEFSYNKVMIFVAIIIGLLTAITQYLKYKSTPKGYAFKKIVWPTGIALLLTLLIGFLMPIQYKKNPVYLVAIYIALFTSIYAVIANSMYIWIGLKGKLKGAGGSVAHAGFALMLVGMLITSGNKQTISDNRVTGINLPMGKDPQTRQQDNPLENLTLVRQLPTRMGPYMVTYIKDSAGSEKGRRFYELLFERKDSATGKVTERFNLYPDVYLMKGGNMSSNPDTKAYLNKDVFTYISYALNEGKREADTAQFNITEMGNGDTAFYSKGMAILNEVYRNPPQNKFGLQPQDGLLLVADVTVITKDSMRYKATPLIQVKPDSSITLVDDTLYAQNLYLSFAGVAGNKIRLGIKESEQLIDFIALKAYIFPHINLVWIGLVIMAVGLLMSMVRRLNLSAWYAFAAIAVAALALFYMFLFAN